MRHNELSGLNEQLLRAAAGEIPFTTIVDLITDQHCAAGGVIFELNRKTGRIGNFVSPSLVIGNDGYSDHLNSINPRMRFSLRHAAGHVAYENKFIDDRGMARHEFYDWLMRDQSMQYFMGTRLYDEGDISVFHSIELGLGRDHPEPEEIEAFSRSSRAIGRAWKLAKRIQPEDLGPQSGGWTPDHLPWSIFAVNTVGAVVQLNSKAGDMIREGGTLHVSDTQLSATDPRSARLFEAALRKSINGEGQDILLCHAATRMQMIAQFIPIDTGAISTPTPIATLIYVWNPMAGRGDLAEVLSTLWRLTRAESRLALLLARGITLADAADQLTISRNTARNQLQCIFEKMQVNRQTELALKIFGIIER